MLLRLSIAMICGGIIGINRGRKNRAAGIRTHMIICMGSALTMILGAYLTQMSLEWGNTVVSDPARISAQVVSGIGFIGVGTIFITGRQQVKGLTTAAGLWASACLGLAIGVGFYLAALICCVFILITVDVFSRIESRFFARSKNMTLCIELERMEALSDIMSTLEDRRAKITDVDISKASKDAPTDRIEISLVLERSASRNDIIVAIAAQPHVRLVEEL